MPCERPAASVADAPLSAAACSYAARPLRAGNGMIPRQSRRRRKGSTRSRMQQGPRRSRPRSCPGRPPARSRRAARTARRHASVRQTRSMRPRFNDKDTAGHEVRLVPAGSCAARAESRKRVPHPPRTTGLKIRARMRKGKRGWGRISHQRQALEQMQLNASTPKRWAKTACRGAPGEANRIDPLC